MPDAEESAEAGPQGDPAQAYALLQRTYQRHPADQDVLAALISFGQARGDTQGVLRYARALAALSPGTPGLRELIRRLEQQPVR